jgi:cytochrome oxidase Cu insertion factor (SCO1/SenC/PrrC family)
MPNSRPRGLPWLVLVLVLLVAGVAFSFAWMRSHEASPRVALPVYGAVPTFRFENIDGKAFGLANLAGHPWVADFIFTNCAGSCPMMTLEMRDLAREIARSPVHLVSFTVDPDRDTLPVLAEYAKQNHADLSQWSFLRASKPDVDRLARYGFKLGVVQGLSPEEPIIHSQKLVLVDGTGRIRGYYDGTDPEIVQKVVFAVGALLREQQRGS